MKFNYRQYLPHATAILVFIIITLAYFKPLLSGKVLRQHDIAMHKGMSKEIADYRVKHNEEPLWTNSMFGGMPAYQISTKYPGNWLSFLDGNEKHSGLFKLFLPHPGGYLFLYCLGFFILLLCLDVDPWLALAGALAYGLSTYFLSIIQAGHNSKANALGYLPALIGGIILIFRGRYWRGFAVTALFTAMEINCNHVQIAYYGYMVIGFLLLGYLVSAIKTKTLPAFGKGLLFLVAATLIGVLPNAGNLMTTNEYGKLSNRGRAELTMKEDRTSNREIASGGLDKDYATNWSYGVSETFSFLIPDFKGGGNRAIMEVDKNAVNKVNVDYRNMVAQSDVYFGDQPSLGAPDYLGAFIIFLAFVGVFIVKNRLKWPLVAVTVLTIMLGWGHNFMSLTSFFMDYVPGYNKFRAVSMIMIVPELTIPLLAVLALNEMLILKDWNKNIHLSLINKDFTLKKIVLFSLIVVGGFCMLSWMAPEMVNTFQATGEEYKMINRFTRGGYPEDQARQAVQELLPQIEVARIAIFKSDALRSLIFILLGFCMLFLFFTGRLKKELTIMCIGLFVFIDLWTVDRRYLNDKAFVTKADNQEIIAGKSAADEKILEDKDPDYRVLNLTVGPFDDASTSYYHKSIGGYHGAKLRRYVDLIDFHLYPEINTFYKGINEASRNDSTLSALFSKLKVLNMLNTKYLIIPAGEEGDKAIPLRNPEASGHAWLVSDLKVEQTPDSEIVRLYDIDIRKQAVINEKFIREYRLATSYKAEGKIDLESYEPNYLVYKSESAAESFAVFSEIYYGHGWNAYVDGKLMPHYQVNYILRGMNLPAGNHKIEFRFEPKTYYTGNSIALAGSILLVLTVAGSLFMERRNKVIVS